MGKTGAATYADFMETIAQRIESQFHEKPNHAIVIKYSHGEEQFTPFHHDKTEGLAFEDKSGFRWGKCGRRENSNTLETGCSCNLEQSKVMFLRAVP